MLKIGNRHYNITMEQVLSKLQNELRRNNSHLLSKSKNSGDYILVTCPYHKNGLERKPSAQFRKSDGLFYCFACKKTEPLPNVISHCLHIDGNTWLKDNFTSNSSIQRQSIVIPEKNKKITQKQYIDKKELKKYRYIHDYMVKCRHIHPSVLKLFDVGYDKEKDCITFPVKDKNGNILFIATRHTKYKRFHYPNNVDKPLYGLYELQNRDVKELRICESMINCLTCWTYGDYAIALNGTGSYNQIEEIKKLPYRKIILMLDNDKAGITGTLRIIEKVKNKLIYVALLPENKDVNDLTKEEYDNLEIITSRKFRELYDCL